MGLVTIIEIADVLRRAQVDNLQLALVSLLETLHEKRDLGVRLGRGDVQGVDRVPSGGELRRVEVEVILREEPLDLEGQGAVGRGDGHTPLDRGHRQAVALGLELTHLIGTIAGELQRLQLALGQGGVGQVRTDVHVAVVHEDVHVHRDVHRQGPGEDLRLGGDADRSPVTGNHLLRRSVKGEQGRLLEAFHIDRDEGLRVLLAILADVHRNLPEDQTGLLLGSLLDSAAYRQ